MAHRAHHSLLILALTLGGWSCDRVLSVPELADLAPLAATYEAPDGSLTATLVEQVLEAAKRRQQLVADVGQLQELTDALRALLAADDLPLDIEAADGGVAPQASPRLVARLRHICAGPAGYEGPPDEDAHGRLELTAVAGSEGLWPVVSGSFEQCAGHAGTDDFLLDGAVDVRLSQLDGQVRMLAQVRGTLQTASDTFEGELDFQLGRSRLEVRVPVASGNLVVGLAEGGSVQLVRDRVATWACAIDRLRCTRMDDGRVLEAE